MYSSNPLTHFFHLQYSVLLHRFLLVQMGKQLLRHSGARGCVQASSLSSIPSNHTKFLRSESIEKTSLYAMQPKKRADGLPRSEHRSPDRSIANKVRREFAARHPFSTKYNSMPGWTHRISHFYQKTRCGIQSAQEAIGHTRSRAHPMMGAMLEYNQLL